MEKTMDYNPVQLVQKLRSVKVRVVPDGINAYEQVAGKSVSFAIIKGDDVGEIVVLEILPVYIKNVIVRTEKYVNISKFTDFALCNELQPLVIKRFTFEFKIDIFRKIPDHNGMLFACKVKSKCREMQKIGNQIFYFYL